MSAEADALCNAEYGQVSDERVNHRNGYRPREWDTRAGSVELAIPKLRQGSYFPHWLLERRRRAEQALISVVAPAYLLGVSTRRDERLAASLGVTQLSKSQGSVMARPLDEQVAAFRNRLLDQGPCAFVWVDALTQKVREGGRIINVHALIAVGVNADGRREVLGIDVATAEDGAGWLAFLIARGLSGVQLVISDAHAGLVDAIGAVLPGASWQRCRTHYARNLLSQVPKSAQPWWPRCCGPSSNSPTPTPFRLRCDTSWTPWKPSSPKLQPIWTPPSTTCWRSPPSLARSGGRSGRTTRRNGWSARCWPSRTTSGPRPAAAWDSTC
ncbi:Transposase, Mutator family [Streptomyces mirabilis]|uniref:Mutator family transposase n=1 Tax=Streptomyces mirabilis TaxID=68239 RepID=A0A1I2US91_9ACTN|nr:Transposase, Mutator family [Streptomyces mirabilis]